MDEEIRVTSDVPKIELVYCDPKENWSKHNQLLGEVLWGDKSLAACNPA